MSKLNWIKDTEWKKDLKGDMREIAELVGIDGFINLWQAFSKTSVYFSEEPINRLRKRYIMQNYVHGRAKELARKLDTSEMFVYDILKGKEKKNQ